MNASFKRVILVLLISMSFAAMADSGYQARVHALIDADQAPEGVVFEIVSGQPQYLDWALPEARRLSMQLRDRFPAVDIAIVTHGAEQFALTRQRLAGNQPLRDTLAALSDNQIQVQVCGTYAERKGVAEEDFSEQVEVAAEGPAQINDYLKLGYERIRISKP